MSTHHSFAVPASHPALPGHFPGMPVVPGVVVLERVLEAAERDSGPLTLSGLRQVKFHAPLRPDETADVMLEFTPGMLKFTVTRRGQVITQGSFLARNSFVAQGSFASGAGAGGAEGGAGPG